MTEITPKDLLLAVLSMDSYNYHAEGSWQVGDSAHNRNLHHQGGDVFS
jgi:hypothetical protein